MRAVFYRVRSRRAEVLYHAWKAGLAKHGINLPLKWEHERRGVEADVAIFYGLWGSLRDAIAEYAAAGRKAVFCDLGYWGRLDGGKVAGFHRIAVNGLHATAYFQRVKHPADRWRYFGIKTYGFRDRGEHILLAGMSEKAAWVYGLGPQEWESAAVTRIASVTKRQIHYRPKPSWKDAQPIHGTHWRGAREPLEGMVQGAHALVTHHGNTALDALINGVPVFCEDGIGSVLAEKDLSRIEHPRIPSIEERDQLLYDAAFTQWKVDEIAEGKAWRYLLEEGLV